MSAAIALQILRCLAPPKPELPTTGGVVSDKQLKPEQNSIERLDDEAVAREVAREIDRQDVMYGAFDSDAGGVRLAIACLEDEVREALQGWDEWKRRPDWYRVRQEAIQIAAVASRLARVPVEIVD